MKCVGVKKVIYTSVIVCPCLCAVWSEDTWPITAVAL